MNGTRVSQLGTGLLIALIGTYCVCQQSGNTKKLTGSTNRSGDNNLPIVFPNSPVGYRLIRQERTVLKDATDFGHDINFEFEVQLNSKSNSGVDMEISNFKGTDLSMKESKHLAKIAKEVNKLRLTRELSANGPAGEVEFVGSNMSGWTGMTVARAVGRYETAFLDCRIPSHSVEVGSTWTADSDLVKETNQNLATPQGSAVSLYGDSSVKQVGTKAEFKLVKISKSGDRDIAEITYKSGGDISVEMDGGPFGKQKSEERVTETGTFWIDLKTGLPDKTKIVRRVELKSQNGRSINEFTTTSERLY